MKKLLITFLFLLIPFQAFAANALYDAGRECFLAGNCDWDADTIKIVLIDTADYTVNLSTHDNLDDVPVAARVATSSALSSKTTTAGVADAADATLTSVSGDSVEAIIIYKDTGTESTSRLIAYIDTATGLPFSPSGGNVVVTWDNGSSRIFKLDCEPYTHYIIVSANNTKIPDTYNCSLKILH